MGVTNVLRSIYKGTVRPVLRAEWRTHPLVARCRCGVQGPRPMVGLLEIGGDR